MNFNDYNVRNNYIVRDNDLHNLRKNLYNWLICRFQEKFERDILSPDKVLKMCKEATLEPFSLRSLNEQVKEGLSGRISISRGYIVEDLIRVAIEGFKLHGRSIYRLNDMCGTKRIRINSDDEDKTQIDVLFEEEYLDSLIYLEVKLKDNHDCGKNKNIVSYLKSITDRIERKIGKKVESYVCFVLADKEPKKKGIEVIIGELLLQKLFGVSVSWFNSVWGDALVDSGFYKSKEDAYQLVDTYFSLSEKIGREEAYNKLM